MSKRVPELWDENWLRHHYVTLEKNSPEISEELGCSDTSVLNALKRFEIPRRSCAPKPALKPGQRIGRLVVLGVARQVEEGLRIYKVRCDCGNETEVRGPKLTRKDTLSCGCYQRECATKLMTRHGHAPLTGHSRTYNTWVTMRQRCRDSKAPNYKYYGALGVSVCDRWNNSFEAFLEDMGERPEGRSLDRIDPYGNYEPSNCRWATPKEQSNNQRVPA
jgi:hypothetical protein